MARIQIAWNDLTKWRLQALRCTFHYNTCLKTCYLWNAWLQWACKLSHCKSRLSQYALIVWVWDGFIHFGSVYLCFSKYDVAITIITWNEWWKLQIRWLVFQNKTSCRQQQDQWTAKSAWYRDLFFSFRIWVKK